MICVIHTFSMTIQNIEDVMDRIMSLNRNLSEESLRTLLSASGWDKEDIIEGLRLFKQRVASAHSFSNTPSPAPAFGPDVKPQDDYAFNLKKEEQKKDTSPIKISLVEENDDLEKLKTEIPALPVEEEKPKKSLPAKIFSLVLVVILIVITLAYLFPSSFGNIIDKLFVKHTTTQNQDIAQSTSSIVSSSSIGEIPNSTTSLETLIQEVSNLRNEFNNYKQASKSSQTIVKYISQRGSTGKAGRGISSISATSTGFVINYTDNTSTIIPYSTTTIISILNTNSVCFRDVTSTSDGATNDICINRDIASRLIASSTLTH